MAAPNQLCPSCETPLPDDAAYCPSCGVASPTEISQETGEDRTKKRPDADEAEHRVRPVETWQTRFERAVEQRFSLDGLADMEELGPAYRARRGDTGQLVRLCVLRPEYISTISKDRIKYQIGLSSQLKHPHIIPILEIDEIGGEFLYYVTPFHAGEDLGDYLGRSGPIRLTPALEIARDIADALTYAHQNGVLHLDLSPNHVIIEGGMALVANFGITRALTEAAGEAITSAGIVIGTPGYMSPEAAAGETLDSRSDIYSLGCILYELLTGSPPFEGATAQQIITRRLVIPPTPLRERGRDDPALQAVLDKALAKDPSERYQTASRFRQELDGLIERSVDLVAKERRRPSVLGRLVRRAAKVLQASDANASPLLKERYSIVRRLGQGGMATVFLAVDNHLDRRVAIKLMKSTLASEIDVERFMQEMTVTSQLSHPHVLQPIDAGEHDGTPFYVMPYVEGGSIRTRLDRDNLLPLKDGLTLTIIAADALQFVHDNSIIHRDIKPENILLHQGYPMLADFGIAHSLRRAAPRLTRRGFALGTPPYWSPEQQAGDEQLDERSDIYSLAAVLYEMLRGEAFARGISLSEVVVPGDHPSDAWEKMQTILERALDADRSRRHESAAEFRDDLRQVRRILRSSTEPT